jgi:putative hydrolase of the HAD superfamily
MARPEAVLLDLDCTLTDRPATIAAFADGFVDHFRTALRFDPPKVHPKEPRATASPSPAENCVASVITAADGNGYEPRAAVFSCLRDTLPWIVPPEPGALEAFWAENFPASTRPAVGLHETLEGLRGLGLRLGLVSNGSAAAQQRKIDALGIRTFLSAITISGALGVRKPTARIFDIALRELGTSPDKSWFVGDHPVLDVLGAEAAGLTAVWRRGVHLWPPEAPYPALHIDRLPELLQLVHPESAARVSSRGIT